MGQTRRRVVDCWDVQGRADGVDGSAVIWAEQVTDEEYDDLTPEVDADGPRPPPRNRAESA